MLVVVSINQRVPMLLVAMCKTVMAVIRYQFRSEEKVEGIPFHYFA